MRQKYEKLPSMQRVNGNKVRKYSDSNFISKLATFVNSEIHVHVLYECEKIHV